MIRIMAVDDRQVLEQGSLRWPLVKPMLRTSQIGAVA